MNEVSKGTLIRTALAFLAIVNLALRYFNVEVLPLGEGEVTLVVEACLGVASVLALLVAWWKNNSFTAAAIAGDNVMHELKEAKKTT